MGERTNAKTWRAAAEAAEQAADNCRHHREWEDARGWAKVARAARRKALWATLRHPLKQS